MAGRVNHRGWIVLLSVANADMSQCVDIFEDPAGGFGFEQFRSDPEDTGSWTPIGGFASTRYDDVHLAAEAASASVGWLSTDDEARHAVREFRDTSTPQFE